MHMHHAIHLVAMILGIRPNYMRRSDVEPHNDAIYYVGTDSKNRTTETSSL